MNKPNLFVQALKRQNHDRPPVWLMRQAGRYHSHYQALRQKYSFIDLCKIPSVACEVTMGPMREFGFDAAILFSDLLFPLEAMGMPLRYDPGPKLDWYLRSPSELSQLRGGAGLVDQLGFQAKAMELIRRELPAEKGLLGFVGGPFTLYCYAVEGSHQGDFASAKAGFRDGRFIGFIEKLSDLLAANMALQARSGADTVAMLDTCAGEVDPALYREFVVPAIRQVLTKFQLLCPGYPVVYYSKGTDEQYWGMLQDLPIAGIGIDWNSPMPEVLAKWGDRWAIQGNVDPQWLHLPTDELEARLRRYFAAIRELPAEKRRGWICGLGHGVLQHTPERNVHRFVQLQREIFSGDGV